MRTVIERVINLPLRHHTNPHTLQELTFVCLCYRSWLTHLRWLTEFLRKPVLATLQKST